MRWPPPSLVSAARPVRLVRRQLERPEPARKEAAIGRFGLVRSRKTGPYFLHQKRQGRDAVAETIEGFVGRSLDEAKISPLHVRAIALIAAGYFFDVIDLIVLGSLIPDMVQSNFATGAQAALVGSATVLGMFIGAAGQGEFSDRFGRKTVYQFNLLIFGIFTILGALAPDVTWLMVARFLAGIGLGGEQPLAFAYAGEYSPKRIRGRILAIVHLIGGPTFGPIPALFPLASRDATGQTLAPPMR